MDRRIPMNTASGEEIFPFEMGYLPPRFQTKAKEELNDTPENRENGILRMRDMAKKDKDLDGINIDDDDFMLQFLRCRKYDVERAFSHFKVALNLTKTHGYLFSNFKFLRLNATSHTNFLTFLPWRCPDGCAILFVQLGMFTGKIQGCSPSEQFNHLESYIFYNEAFPFIKSETKDPFSFETRGALGLFSSLFAAGSVWWRLKRLRNERVAERSHAAREFDHSGRRKR